MKRKSLLFLPLLISSLTVTSCTGMDKYLVLNNVDYSISTSTIGEEVDSEQLLNLIKNKHSFVLYQYSEHCSSCKIVGEYVNEYAKQSHNQIYKYNVMKYYNSSYSILSDYDSYVFPESRIVTPRIMYFQNGQYSTQMNPSKFDSYKLFSLTMDNYIYSSTKAYTFKTTEGYETLKNQNYNFFTYSSQDAESSSIYANNLYPILSQIKNATFVIVDVAFISTELLSTIKSDLNLSNDYSFVTSSKEEITYLTDTETFISYLNDID